MTTEQLIEHWKQEMMAKGFAQGYAEGFAQGYAEGFAQGYAEGRAQARIEERIKALRHVYQARFGPMPARLRKALAAKVTVETALSWVTFFVTAASTAEIAAAIRKGTPTH